MRLLYISRSDNAHDARFVDAWKSAGLGVTALTIRDHGIPARKAIRAAVARVRPTIVQTGPLTYPAHDVAAVWNGPLIATSWGFDLLHEATAVSAAQRAGEVLARADLVFVDNDAVLSRAITLGADIRKVEVFPWGLDASWMRAGAAPPTRDEVVFLSSRRHEPIYRVADIVEAFSLVAPIHPHAYLVVAGTGTLTDSLRADADSTAAGKRITFVGELGREHLAATYRSADAYLTATSVDGTSVSLLEAMASGTPVIASRIEGNAQWVTPQTGFDFPCGDVHALSEIISAFAEPTETFRRDIQARVDNARELVRTRANWPETVKMFSAFAAKAISGARSRNHDDGVEFAR